MWAVPQETSPTLQRVLLHLDFIELVGSNDDAVSGQMDAAARLRGFDLLEKREAWTNISSLQLFTDFAYSGSLCIAPFIFIKGSDGNLKVPRSLRSRWKRSLAGRKSSVLLDAMLA